MMQIDWFLEQHGQGSSAFGISPWSHTWTWQCCSHEQLLAGADALIFGALAVTRPLLKAKPKVCRSEVEIDPMIRMMGDRHTRLAEHLPFRHTRIYRLKRLPYPGLKAIAQGWGVLSSWTARAFTQGHDVRGAFH